jgi:cytochrome c553
VDTPEDRFYNPAKINTWFAVSAVLALATGAAAVLADHYDREWKGYQRAFHDLEKEAAAKVLAPPAATAGAQAIRNRLVRGDEAAATGPSTLDAKAFGEAIAALRNEPEFPAGAVLAAADYDAEASGLLTKELEAIVATHEKERDDAEEKRFKTEKEQRELQALADEHKFNMDHATSLGHAREAEAAKKEWERVAALEKETRGRMDGFAAAKNAALDRIKEAMAPVAERTGRASRLREMAGVGSAERKMAGFVAHALRDAPLLDPFAPVTRIQQIVLPDLVVDYNFAKIPRVDRCMTCHSGIDKVKVDPGTGDVTPLYTAENTKERVFRTHPKPELYVSSVSPHSMTKVGCTVCHDGQGMGLSFADAYHTPNSPEQEKEWEEKHHWHRGESWDFPMLPMKHIEASCLKCHSAPPKAAPQDRFAREIPRAPRWNSGLRLVEKSGCFGCHKIDGLAVPGLDKWIGEIPAGNARDVATASSLRRTGPALGRIPSKWRSKEAAWNWIWHPASLRPTTNMPRFFGQPNNSGVDPQTRENYDLRTQTEVWGLVTLLWENGEAWTPEAPRAKGDAARGKALFGGVDEDGKPTGVGCLACHTTRDFPDPAGKARGNDFGPDLSTVGSKTTEAWLYDWVKNPAHYWPGTRMPDLRLTDAQAADVAAYLATLRDEAWEKKAPPPLVEAAVRDLAVEAVRAKAQKDEDPVRVVEAMTARDRLMAVGRRAVEKYACFACHEVKGFEKAERIGTELGGSEGWGHKDVDRLDFGLLMDPHAVKTYEAWGTDAVPLRPDGSRALPKRRHEWARTKLLNPRIFDAGVTKQPHEKLVMPNFGFTPEEADDVVTFLLSLQKGEIAPSRRFDTTSCTTVGRKNWIARQYNCYGCHTLRDGQVSRWDPIRKARFPFPTGHGREIAPWLGTNKDHWPPSLGGEGFVGEGARVKAGWLFDFLRSPGDPAGGDQNMLRFWMSTRMPTFALTPAEINALVAGFAAEDGVPFPFEVEEVRPLSGKDAADAAALFQALECASCHPTRGASGPPPSGLAPDLVYAFSRLRHEWVRLWLDDPARILPGTKMPPFWRPDDVTFETPSTLTEKNYFGNDPHGQIRAITDHVFGIGAPRKGAAPK